MSLTRKAIIIISSIRSQHLRRNQSYCNGVTSQGNFNHFCTSSKSRRRAKTSIHSYNRTRLCLNRVLEFLQIPLLSNWARCHQITSWKLLISCHLKQLILLPRQRQKLYWTLTSIYASDFVSLKIYIATRLSSYFKGCYINF